MPGKGGSVIGASKARSRAIECSPYCCPSRFTPSMGRTRQPTLWWATWA